MLPTRDDPLCRQDTQGYGRASGGSLCCRQRPGDAVEYAIADDHFSTEDEALEEIASLGLHPAVLDFVGQEEEFHFHEFDAVFFVLDGTASAERPDGSVLSAGAGARVQVPTGWVHRDVPGTTFRAAVGFGLDPAEWTEPLNKPLVNEG